MIARNDFLIPLLGTECSTHGRTEKQRRSQCGSSEKDQTGKLEEWENWPSISEYGDEEIEAFSKLGEF